MYRWRTLSEEQRQEVMLQRRLGSKPWHTPPHPLGGPGNYHLTAACYEHRSVIGHTPARMTHFAEELLKVLVSVDLHAWCLLPNHYHLYLTTPNLDETIAELGRLHGRSSFLWNREENTKGRQVWHGIADRQIRSEAHGWATLNYVHHNPVRHGYAEKWQEWPWSSAAEYLAQVGEAEAATIWRTYPVLDYGAKWDEPSL